MKAKPDWWKGFFNEIYLLTDARTVLNQQLARQEADIIEKVLDLDKSAKILDLCGGHGRHCLELARRGYQDLTVLDYSKYLVELGKRLAKKAGVKINFICRDARKSGLPAGGFSAVIVMANSFGYFPQEQENLRLLREIIRLLRCGGRLLLDLADPDYIRRCLQPFSWHLADEDILVCRKREIKGEIIQAREIVISKKQGLLRDGCYCERLYTKEKIRRLLEQAGFSSLAIKKNVSLHRQKKDFGLVTSRMLVTAQK